MTYLPPHHRKVISAYLAGTLLKLICHRFHLTPQGIYHILDRYAIPRMRKPRQCPRPRSTNPTAR